MKTFAVVFLLAASLLGQSVVTKETKVTGVAGESWLSHLHRNLEETSMGKTGRLGPPMPVSAEEAAAWQQGLPADFRQTVTIHGSDLYRMNCQGCHGESGLGAPPEINSVINPTRSTSVAMIMERMKQRGMDISHADATELANQSKAGLLQRLHSGGTDMPPFPQLSDAEVRAIYAYLKQLAEVPGAEKAQVSLEESPVRVGEHIVKSTCHICHSAAGPNPTPEQLSNGAIPPLSTLTARTTLPEFARKVKTGSPIVMGTPAMPCRGRMPVFFYLSDSEVADAYLYLTLYPPYKYAVLDPALPAPPPMAAASKLAPFAVDAEPAKPAQPANTADVKIVAVPVAAEIFVALLLIGGIVYTLLEVKRIAERNKPREIVVIDGSKAIQAAMQATAAGVRLEQAREIFDDRAVDDQEIALSLARVPLDHNKIESSWLSRRLEKKNWVA